jgi:glycosyltransferase involved in cell wall biosynthesis
MPDRPLRCAFLNHYVDWGGAEGMLLTLFEAVDRERLEPTLVVPGDGRLPEGARALGVPVVVVPMSAAVLEVTRSGGGPITAARAAAGLAAAIARLTRALRSLDVDVVVTNSAKAHVYGSIAASLSRKPVVWRLHDTLDSPDFGSSLYRLMIAIAKRVPRLILTVSDSCAAPLLRNGVSPDRVVTLYNGIDLSPFTAVPRAKPGNGAAFSIGSFGRLTPLKGHDVVIRAVARLAADGHDVQLVIAGGPAREAPGYDDVLISIARELGVDDRIRIEAGFPAGGLPAIMAGVDVVAQASVLPDSLPTTVIEAMAGGRAVVASAIGGCPELVDHDRTGLLFEPGNVDALADCLAGLLADPARLERLGQEAREDAVRRFAVDGFADSFCNQIENVVQGSAGKQ